MSVPLFLLHNSVCFYAFSKYAVYIPRYLGVSGRQFGRPISGQAEVIGESSMSSTSQWLAMEGLFIHKNDFDSKTIRHDPSEL